MAFQDLEIALPIKLAISTTPVGWF